MTYRDFQVQIKKGKIKPFYLFAGEEEYLKQEALRKLKEKIGVSGEQLNFTRLNASSMKARDIIEAAFQIPFGSKWQLLVVEETERLKSRDKERLLEYLKKPVASTCIVFMIKEAKREDDFFHFFKKKGAFVRFFPLRGENLLNWIREKVEERGKSISEEALFELERRMGNNLYLLENEIEKLSSFIHPGSCIEKEHVILLCGETVGKSVFDFLAAFRARNLNLAVSLLQKLFEQGREPLYINFMLVREVRHLLFIKLSSLKEKLNLLSVAEHLFPAGQGTRDFYLKIAQSYIEATRLFSLKELILAQQKMLKAEYLLKTGESAPHLLIQKLVIEILSPPADSLQNKNSIQVAS
ncbi:DNA polymerase III subunit delta [Candidatus Aerophobetes bacterium]|nr:DNA polymerase III subunit delta [Candidatus Aerophobetes bacterium]